jgi:alkanesulfonate monooxygenase SsuD/methylene tetrahydromethanopterin reductase-like flavin-dependent oxidoreductase (luciferase family)
VDAGDATRGGDAEARLREGLGLLRRLWTETEVSWRGRFWPALDGATLEPRPVQRPHPPLWLAARATAEAADLAGSLGLSLLLPAAAASSGPLSPLAARHRDAARTAGHAGTSLRLGLVGSLEIPLEKLEQGGPELLQLLGFSAPDTNPAAPGGPAPRGAVASGAPRETALAAARAVAADRLLLCLDLGHSEAAPQALRARLEALAAALHPHLGESQGSATGSLAAPGPVR